MNEADFPVEGALAPIVVFAYNRPAHLRNLLASLEKCPEFRASPLRIFIDGPKREEDKASVEAVRGLVADFNHPHLKFFASERNKGLANSVISAVTLTVNEFGRVIAIEDDLIVSPGFLKFMNDALSVYQMEKDVIAATGFIFPIDQEGLPETLFCMDPGSLGWATWADRWALFEPDEDKLLRELKKRKLVKHFNFEGAFGSDLMLQAQHRGNVDSWAIRWLATAVISGKVSLCPRQSMVAHMGIDKGTHYAETGVGDRINSEILLEGVAVEWRKPELDVLAHMRICEFTKRTFFPCHKMRWRIFNAAKRRMTKLLRAMGLIDPC